jgi:haloacetate dehalogenase
MIVDRRTILTGAAALAVAPVEFATAAEPTQFFPGFRALDLEAGGVRFAGVVGGSGPPLLLLHGYPETRIAWRKIAGDLARHYTVIAPDLPGYGASRLAAMSPRWTKRRVSEALLALMRGLGHERFAIVGHDRGARAGYRLALDRPGVVTAFASLTVVPTLDVMESANYSFARKNYHWFLFSQPDSLTVSQISMSVPSCGWSRAAWATR